MKHICEDWILRDLCDGVPEIIVVCDRMEARFFTNRFKSIWDWAQREREAKTHCPMVWRYDGFSNSRTRVTFITVTFAEIFLAGRSGKETIYVDLPENEWSEQLRIAVYSLQIKMQNNEQHLLNFLRRQACHNSLLGMNF